MFNLNSDSEDENNGESTPTYGKSINWRMRPLNMWNGRFQFFIEVFSDFIYLLDSFFVLNIQKMHLKGCKLSLLTQTFNSFNSST